MNLFIHRSLKIITILFCFLTIIVGIFPYFTLAQEAAPFEIKILPHAEYAVAGEIFTYTIMITNVSDMPLKDIIVYVPSITGTTLAATYHINDNWLIGKPISGETGQVAWVTLNPVTPGEVVTFDLMLNIVPEMANQSLIFEKYAILSQSGGDIIATGPPLKTVVRVTVPTATPTPTVPTPTLPPTLTQTPTVMITSTPAATQTPEITQTATPTMTPTPMFIPDQRNSKTTSSFFSLWTIVILSVLLSIGAIFGLILFFKYNHD